MPDYPALITTRLTGHAPLLALLTGGIYNYEALPRNGIKAKPQAWNNGLMKPCCVVKARPQVPFGDIKDSATQFTTSRQGVELWLYNDGDAGYTSLRSAQQVILTLLHLRRVAGAFQMRFAGDLAAPDPELNNAATLRLEYTVIGHLGG
jgi:hypothetical protein